MTAEPCIDAFIQPANHPYFVKEKTFWTIDRAAAVAQKCRAANPFRTGNDAVPVSSVSLGNAEHSLPECMATSDPACTTSVPRAALHRLPGRSAAADDDLQARTCERCNDGECGPGSRAIAPATAVALSSSSSSPTCWPRRSSYLSGSRMVAAAASETNGTSRNLAFLTESIKRKKTRRQQQPAGPKSEKDGSGQSTKGAGLPTSLQSPAATSLFEPSSGLGGFLNAGYEACHGDVTGISNDSSVGNCSVLRDVEQAAEASEDGDWDAGSDCNAYDGCVSSHRGGGFAGRCMSSGAASDALSVSGSSCHEDDIQPVALILHVADDHCRNGGGGGSREDGSGAATSTGGGGSGGLPSLTRRWFSRQKHDGSSSGGASGSGSLRYHRDSGRGQAQPPGQCTGGGGGGCGSSNDWTDGAGLRGDGGNNLLLTGSGAASGKPPSLSPRSFGRLPSRTGNARARSRSRSPSNYSCSSAWLLPELVRPPHSPSYGSVDSLTHVLPPIGVAGTSAGRRRLQQLQQQQQESSFFDIVVTEPMAVTAAAAAASGGHACPPGRQPGIVTTAAAAAATGSTARPFPMSHHVEQFGVDEGDDDNDDTIGGGRASRRARKWQRHRRRRRLIIVAVLFLVGVVTAGAIAAYLLTAGKSASAAPQSVSDGSQPGNGRMPPVLPTMATQEPSTQLLLTPGKQTRFTGTILLKIEYTQDMVDLKSTAARNVSSQFCDTVKRIYGERNSTSNMVYDNCTVTQLLPGSVKVLFKITFNETGLPFEPKFNHSTQVEEVRKVLESEVSTLKFGTFPCDAEAVKEITEDEAPPPSPVSSAATMLPSVADVTHTSSAFETVSHENNISEVNLTQPGQEHVSQHPAWSPSTILGTTPTMASDRQQQQQPTTVSPLGSTGEAPMMTTTAEELVAVTMSSVVLWDHSEVSTGTAAAAAVVAETTKPTAIGEVSLAYANESGGSVIGADEALTSRLPAWPGEVVSTTAASTTRARFDWNTLTTSSIDTNSFAGNVSARPFIVTTAPDQLPTTTGLDALRAASTSIGLPLSLSSTGKVPVVETAPMQSWTAPAAVTTAPSPLPLATLLETPTATQKQTPEVARVSSATTNTMADGLAGGTSTQREVARPSSAAAAASTMAAVLTNGTSTQLRSSRPLTTSSLQPSPVTGMATGASLAMPPPRDNVVQEPISRTEQQWPSTTAPGTVTGAAATDSPVGSTVVTAAFTADLCPLNVDVLYPNTTDCRAYYMCSNGTFVPLECQVGKYYSEQAKACKECNPSKCSLCSVSRSERAGDAGSVVAASATTPSSFAPARTASDAGSSDGRADSRLAAPPDGPQLLLPQPCDDPNGDPSGSSLESGSAETPALPCRGAPGSQPTPSHSATGTGTWGGPLWPTASPGLDDRRQLTLGAPATAAPRSTSATNVLSMASVPSLTDRLGATASFRQPAGLSTAEPYAAVATAIAAANPGTHDAAEQQQPSMATGRTSALPGPLKVATSPAALTDGARSMPWGASSVFPVVATTARHMAASHNSSGSSSSSTTGSAPLQQQQHHHPCLSKPRALVADASDCRKYMFCQSNGKAVTAQCESHQMYSAAHNDSCVPCDVTICPLCQTAEVDRK